MNSPNVTRSDRIRHRDVVLVHGMWHQPEHFAALREVLETHDYRVRIPRLHRGSLVADVDAVQAEIDACSAPPVVVGHSYGGAVIGHTIGSRAMLFIAAFVLKVGESCALVGGAPKLTPAIITHEQCTILDPALAPHYLFADCTTKDSDTGVRSLTAQASGHGRTPAWRSTWADVQSRYVVCGEDRALDINVQRQMAARCGGSVTMSASHSAYISRASAVAEQILVLETQASKSSRTS